MRTIVQGGEYMRLHDNGQIERTGRNSVAPSGQWRVTGAVQRNNFGAAVRRYTLQEILDAPDKIPWRFKNGKQQTFITDLDHGTSREWRSPNHWVS